MTHAALVRPAAASPSELCAGLIADCCEGDHWCYGDGFVQLCGLSHEQMGGVVRSWWGSREVWLDMFATEVARAICVRVGVEDGLGAGWLGAVDAWLDAAYGRATAGSECPPQRSFLPHKASLLVHQILFAVGPGAGGAAPPMRCAALRKAVTVDCAQCGKAFSQRLGACPSCVPLAPRRQPQGADGEVDPEAQQMAEWRRLPSAWGGKTAVPWAEASKSLKCSGGSGGVVLLRLPTGVVCVKRCTAPELFAQRLAAGLRVRTAEMRMVAQGVEEAVALKRALQVAEPCLEDQRWKILGLCTATSLAVMEFVDGFTMVGVSAHRHLQQSGGCTPTWHELGRLMAFDLLINNGDRLPLAWPNVGNLCNVMLGSSLGAVVGIDQSICPITHEDGLRSYLGRVRQAVAEACRGEGEAFGAVRTAVFNNTAVELTADELRSIRRGCQDFLIEVDNRATCGELDEVLAAVAEEVASECAVPGEESQDLAPPMAACCELVRAVVSAVQDEVHAET